MARAVEAAYERIREGILSGAMKRGTRLREERLAEEIGVSRTPVREALRRLSSEGLVEFLPNRGARVSAWSARELEDLYEIRAMLEGHAARLAAQRITGEEIAHLDDLATQMEAADDLADVKRLNSEFHRLIVRASRNSQLDTLVRGIVDTPLVHRTFETYSDERRQASHAHHRDLVAALRAGNPEWAESMMRAHIRAAQTTVVNFVSKEADDQEAAPADSD